MKKMIAFLVAMLMAVCMLTVFAFAEEVEITTDEAISENEPITEDEIITEIVGEKGTELEDGITSTMVETTTEFSTNTESESETEVSVQVDEWIYSILKQATPEQAELIEGIVLGGLDALDKLEIDGWDRVRVWVEHNMATVMVVALIVALVALAVISVLQKRGFSKKATVLNSNAIEMYNAGQQLAEEAHKACKTYADRADKICHECAGAAQAAAKTAEVAHGEVLAERALMIKEIKKNTQVNAALCETVNFLLQCSDLSQAKRDEAEMIFKKGMEAMSGDESDEA